MLTRTLRSRLAVPLGAALFATAGCSSSTAPSDPPPISVAGPWVGTVRLPNAYTASLGLQQNGSAVSGTMRISGVMNETPIAGDVSTGGRTMTWRVNRSCEVWTGTATVDATGRSMTGPLAIDRTGCQPAQSSGSGTLSVDRR